MWKTSGNLFGNHVLITTLVYTFFNSSRVNGHGMLDYPKPRQYCNPDELRWKTAPSGGMGGGSKTQSGGVPGFCGDPFQNWDESDFGKRPCAPQAEWEENSIVEIAVKFVANHGGHYRFSVCPLDGLTEECVRNPDNHLTDPRNGAIDWYIPKYEGGDPKSVSRMQLPAGVSGEKMVFVWTWWTAHQCVYDCDPDVCGPYAGNANAAAFTAPYFAQAKCETRWPKLEQLPQIFRNCADVTIVPKAGGGTIKPAPKLQESKIDPEFPEIGGGSGGAPGNTSGTDTASVDSMANNTSTEVGDGMGIDEDEDCYDDDEVADSTANTQGAETGKAGSGWSDGKGGGGDSKADEYSQQGTIQTGYRRLMMPGDKPGGDKPGKNPGKKGGAVVTDDGVDEDDERGIPALSPLSSGEIDCGHGPVHKAMKEINAERSEVGAPPLMCNNKATGVASGLSGIMCLLKSIEHAQKDTCTMTEYGAGCKEIVAATDGASPFSGLAKPDLEKLMDRKVLSVGVGSMKCGNGLTYWTFLAK